MEYKKQAKLTPEEFWVLGWLRAKELEGIPSSLVF